MTLGNYIKQRRATLGQSQPELAEVIGIEQSYLSKLENDKSIPSNDIFRRLLSALNSSVEDVVATLDKNYVQTQLLAIADIETHIKQHQARSLKSQRNYLYSCGILIVIAITFIFTGYSKLLFSEKHYVYESSGIILPGEPKHIFHQWERMVVGTDEQPRHKLLDVKRAEMTKRTNIEHVVESRYQGEEFMKDVEGGQRYFYLDTHTDISRSENAWLQIIGVLLLAAGVYGLIIERRLYRA
ncbi:helix-turn-helix transcriptional regulator [Thalassotalea fusca]